LFLPFLVPRFHWGTRESEGVESQASVCFVGRNPVWLRAEPTKQKSVCMAKAAELQPDTTLVTKSSG
jgi:hypothetical protein